MGGRTFYVKANHSQSSQYWDHYHSPMSLLVSVSNMTRDQELDNVTDNDKKLPFSFDPGSRGGLYPSSRSQSILSLSASTDGQRQHLSLSKLNISSRPNTGSRREQWLFIKLSPAVMFFLTINCPRILCITALSVTKLLWKTQSQYSKRTHTLHCYQRTFLTSFIF